MSTTSIIMTLALGVWAFFAASDSESGPLKRAFAIGYLIVRGGLLLTFGSVSGGWQPLSLGALLVVGAIVGWFRGR